jgi:UDP-glucose 4-epimerase
MAGSKLAAFAPWISGGARESPQSAVTVQLGPSLVVRPGQPRRARTGVILKVLVTGGAGYIGSTIAAALSDAGDEPVILDDLSQGSRAFLAPYTAYEGDVADPDLIAAVFAEQPDIELVIHCAGRTSVEESVRDPLGYYQENVGKTVDFLAALGAAGCDRVVFSSSASVYGTVSGPVVTEQTPLAPASPYARSKIMIEDVLTDTCAATGLRALSLRYFNPIGADPRHRTGPYKRRAADAMGALLAAWEDGRAFRINGADWPTEDGTPLRDFVHVRDVAEAHVAAARRWSGSRGRHDVLNVGSGRGTTVRRLAETFNAHVERPVAIEYGGRRAGDTVGAYTRTDRATAVLGWRPQRSVEDAVVDALAWAAQRSAVLHGVTL